MEAAQVGRVSIDLGIYREVARAVRDAGTARNLETSDPVLAFEEPSYWTADVEVCAARGRCVLISGFGDDPDEALRDLARELPPALADIDTQPHLSSYSRTSQLWKRIERDLPDRWHIRVSGPSDRSDHPYAADLIAFGKVRLRGTGFSPDDALVALGQLHEADRSADGV